MTPVYSSRDIRSIDAHASDVLGIPSLVLMENAARGVCDVLLEVCNDGGIDISGARILIACGSGNNGGDGLALTRHLLIRNADVTCVLVSPADEMSHDARAQLDMLRSIDSECICAAADVGTLGVDFDIVVDALLGTGARGAPRDAYARLLEALERCSGIRVAVDVSTGLDADTGLAHDAVFDADITVTMAAMKPGLLLNAGRELSGAVYTAHIGVPPTAYPPPACWLLDAEAVAGMIPPVAQTRHKYDRGRVLVIGGSRGMFGAPVMAAHAALHCGAGLTVLSMPSDGAPLPHAVAPEVMTHFQPASDEGAFDTGVFDGLRDQIERADALVVGPGISRSVRALELVRACMGVSAIVVLDADGLAAYAGAVDELAHHSCSLIITPHVGEMARLTGLSAESIGRDPLGCARDVARRANAVVVLKGAPTVIAAPDGRSWINTAGNPGMATGGTGDVLAGIIASMSAQLRDAERGALVGVLLHSTAADIAIASTTEHAMIASDIIRSLPSAFAAIGGDVVE